MVSASLAAATLVSARICSDLISLKRVGEVYALECWQEVEGGPDSNHAPRQSRRVEPAGTEACTESPRKVGYGAVERLRTLGLGPCRQHRIAFVSDKKAYRRHRKF